MVVAEEEELGCHSMDFRHSKSIEKASVLDTMATVLTADTVAEAEECYRTDKVERGVATWCTYLKSWCDFGSR